MMFVFLSFFFIPIAVGNFAAKIQKISQKSVKRGGENWHLNHSFYKDGLLLSSNGNEIIKLNDFRYSDDNMYSVFGRFSVY
jgi:hypothetical protein